MFLAFQNVTKVSRLDSIAYLLEYCRIEIGGNSDIYVPADL